MSHEINQINGKDSMAYTGKKPWHGLGQKLTEGASLEMWAQEACLDWTVIGDTVKFTGSDGTLYSFFDRKVLYRSDNGQALEVVSKGYQAVQPIEVLEFFRSYVDAGDMQLETAGSIHDGKKIWAMAKVDADFEVGAGDEIQSRLLLATSFDKSLATVAKPTSVRVVCNNTLSFAINEKTPCIRIPHNTSFKPDEVKEQLGLVKETFAQNQEKIEKLQKTSVSQKEAIAFFTNLLTTPAERESDEVDISSKKRSMTKLFNAYQKAPGQENTAWGLVNAVSYAVDHNPSARSDSTRLNSAWFGAGEKMKQEAYKLAQDTDFLGEIIENTQLKHRDAVERIFDIVAA